MPKKQRRTYRYKSLKSWKIDNIELTQQFSLSIFTDFRYQSIKITWLLSIFIDWLLLVMGNYLLKEIALHHFALMFLALDFAQDDWWLLQIAYSTLFVVSRGYTSLLVPGDDPPQDITIFMDIALNPGPSASESLTGASSINASFLVNQNGDFDPVIALRWLDWIFWGWYLPSLSINYVGMSKDIEKMLPQLYYIKMKIS